MDERQLIEAAQSGQLPAFNQLVLRYQTLAYNIAYRIMGEQEAAADVTQDSFLKAYKSLAKFRGGTFKSWLLRIVTNTCYDYLRARKRKPTSNLDDAIENPEHSLRFTDSAETPAQYAERSELSQALQWAIAQLPPDQRTVVVLSDIQGMPYGEIAEITGVSLGTVKSRLSRARKKLQQILQAKKELLPQRYRLKHTGMS